MIPFRPIYPRAVVEVVLLNHAPVLGGMECTVTPEPGSPRYVNLTISQLQPLPDGTLIEPQTITVPAAQLALALTLARADYIENDVAMPAVSPGAGT